MPKLLKPKTELQIKQINQTGLHAVGGTSGLYLQVKSDRAKSWILRANVAGKRRDIGLGSYSIISLREAREKALAAKQQIQSGIDPIQEKNRQKDAQALERASRKTFIECADAYINSVKAKWTNSKSEHQWRSSLEQYAYPIIGNLPVSQIENSHVLNILEPIWTSKSETARRVRARIENILAYATTRGFRTGDNPARYKGHLETILPAMRGAGTDNHFPALDYQEIQAFIEDLRKLNGSSARGLEFTILTACRSGETRGATWDEIDFEAKLWTIPAHRMKAKKEHTIPLSKQVIELLKGLPKTESDIIFPSPRGLALSDMSLSKALKTLHQSSIDSDGAGYVDSKSQNKRITVHGFRSTFRDWAAEKTNHQREVIEHALAHQLSNKVEAAYQRRTALPKRKALMQDWANFCEKAEPKIFDLPLYRKGN